MAKKGNWFSALRKAFTSSSKDNLINSTEKKNVKEKKKWGFGRTKHGEVNAFIPLYREPSSIEKILGDAEREQQHNIHRETAKKAEHIRAHRQEPYFKQQQETNFKAHHQEPHFRAINRQEPIKNVQQFRAPQKSNVARNKRAITQNLAHVSAIRIQAAYRGYMGRKSYRALKGLVRLQRVMRGQSVKRQTTNTMRCMQLLVKVQSQVRARRLQMIEGQNLQQQRQTPRQSDKDVDSSFSKWNLTTQSVAEDDEWDDSVYTKEERDARTRRKVEAVIKRERALAYAYSHQLLKVTPKSAHAVLTDIRHGGFPLWWNWLDRQLPHEPTSSPLPKTPTLTPKFTSAAFSSALLRTNNRTQPKKPVHDILDVPTPHSSITTLPTPRGKLPSNVSNKWHQTKLRDDESLTSCPAFTAVPNYMQPTVSAKAKVRDSPVTEKDSREGEKKRFSFSLTQSIGSLMWNKGPLFVSKEPVPVPRRSGKHRSSSSIGGWSVDSTVSLPVGVGRKPFK